jgi:hypothetical protein
MNTQDVQEVAYIFQQIALWPTMAGSYQYRVTHVWQGSISQKFNIIKVGYEYKHYNIVLKSYLYVCVYILNKNTHFKLNNKYIYP